MRKWQENRKLELSGKRMDVCAVQSGSREEEPGANTENLIIIGEGEKSQKSAVP